MTYKVFIDGAEGTTGLKIHSYFTKRNDLKIISIDDDKRKDLDERLKMIKKADISFLCLPDDAAREIAGAVPKECRIIDTSTAHRTNDSWVYGMPELSCNQREKIRHSNRVAVPGCHATGVILLTKPLYERGIINKEYPLSAFSITGYSGGGKKMIAQYENNEVPKSPRQYGLGQHHKHLPEIIKMTGMKNVPAFIPVVADYFKGMKVTVPLNGKALEKNASENVKIKISEMGAKAVVEEALKETYEEQPLVSFTEKMDEDGFISADSLSQSNRLKITTEGNDENILLIAVYDNLGKGASGAAIQNMNIMLGIDERTGLI